jgi:hypothetical protein
LAIEDEELLHQIAHNIKDPNYVDLTNHHVVKIDKHISEYEQKHAWFLISIDKDTNLKRATNIDNKHIRDYILLIDSFLVEQSK